MNMIKAISEFGNAIVGMVFRFDYADRWVEDLREEIEITNIKEVYRHEIRVAIRSKTTGRDTFIDFDDDIQITFVGGLPNYIRYQVRERLKKKFNMEDNHAG